MGREREGGEGETRALITSLGATPDMLPNVPLMRSDEC